MTGVCSSPPIYRLLLWVKWFPGAVDYVSIEEGILVPFVVSVEADCGSICAIIVVAWCCVGDRRSVIGAERGWVCG